MNKQIAIAFDFDGIISNAMFYDNKAKCMKQLQYAVAQGFNMLAWLGVKYCVMTSDRTDSGKAITMKALSNCNVKCVFVPDAKLKLQAISQKFCRLDNVIYVGDDIHDVAVARQVQAFITHDEAPSAVQAAADYVIKHSNYTFFEICCYIANSLQVNPNWFAYTGVFSKLSVGQWFATIRPKRLLFAGIYPKDDNSMQAVTDWFNTNCMQYFADCKSLQDVLDKYDMTADYANIVEAHTQDTYDTVTVYTPTLADNIQQIRPNYNTLTFFDDADVMQKMIDSFSGVEKDWYCKACMSTNTYCKLSIALTELRQKKLLECIAYVATSKQC